MFLLKTKIFIENVNVQLKKKKQQKSQNMQIFLIYLFCLNLLIQHLEVLTKMKKEKKEKQQNNTLLKRQRFFAIWQRFSGICLHLTEILSAASFACTLPVQHQCFQLGK